MVAPPVSPDPTSLQFKAKIRRSEASSIFEIEEHGNRYALKVFHDNGDPGLTASGRDMNRFRNVNGLVPKYYGSVERLDPSCHQPWLNDFLKDKFHPSAIVLEYLADPEPLNCVNYSKERHSKAMKALAQVHGALVVHNDIYPRNILIVPGDPERVVLIDFDVAKTFPTKELLDQETGIHWPEPVQACDWELQLLGDYGNCLEEDQKEGLPPNTKFY